jgi:hypothetical protein
MTMYRDTLRARLTDNTLRLAHVAFHNTWPTYPIESAYEAMRTVLLDARCPPTPERELAERRLDRLVESVNKLDAMVNGGRNPRMVLEPTPDASEPSVDVPPGWRHDHATGRWICHCGYATASFGVLLAHLATRTTPEPEPSQKHPGCRACIDGECPIHLGTPSHLGDAPASEPPSAPALSHLVARARIETCERDRRQFCRLSFQRARDNWGICERCGLLEALHLKCELLMLCEPPPADAPPAETPQPTLDIQRWVSKLESTIWPHEDDDSFNATGRKRVAAFLKKFAEQCEDTARQIARAEQAEAARDAARRDIVAAERAINAANGSSALSLDNVPMLVQNLRAERDALKAELATAVRLAREATNGWAAHASRNREHNEISRLHLAISALNVPAPPTEAQEQAAS